MPGEYSTRESMQGRKGFASRGVGFTLVEIMIVVAIIGLLAAIAIPSFVRARSTSQMNTCINNLRLIDAAKQQWVLETGQATSALPFASDIRPYLGRARAQGSLASVTCPLDPDDRFATSYTINTADVAPVCQINGVDSALESKFLHILPN